MNEQSPRRGVVIVAGGRSQRMGHDKAWLRIGEEHLLQRVVRLSLGAARWVVVAASPGQVLPALSGDAVRADDPAERAGGGPLAGVLTGLETLSHSGVELAYLGSVDAVRLTTNHITHVLDLLQAEGHHCAVVPETGPLEHGGRVLHGLCGAVRVPVAVATARALLRSRNRSVRALYEGLHARRLDASRLPDPEVIRGCNTPEQWYEALADLVPPP
jgi:molybdenum cofactor guanylyltransferase